MEEQRAKVESAFEDVVRAEKELESARATFKKEYHTLREMEKANDQYSAA